jgi:hypothetical protein
MAHITITSTTGKTLRIVDMRILYCGCPNRECQRAVLLDAYEALAGAVESLSDDDFWESDAEDQLELARLAHKASERECDAQGPGLNRWTPPRVPAEYIPDHLDNYRDAAMDAAKEARLGY